MAGEALYLDSSALVKLVIEEAESEALLELFSAFSLRVASSLAKVEVPRAVGKTGDGAKRIGLWDRVREDVSFIAIDDQILTVAARLVPPTLRSLDAIHLASALALGESLAGFVAYDSRLVDAAMAVPLPVMTPGGMSSRAERQRETPDISRPTGAAAGAQGSAS